MDHIEKYGIYFLALILLAYHFRFPCNMRLYFGLVAFSTCIIVCNGDKNALNDALLVGMVVAISSDIYKKYLKASFEGFKEGDDDYEDKKEKMKNHKKSKKQKNNIDELDFDEYINIEQTLKENVKNIDTETLETMTKQTEKFMTQQEKLLNVVEKLGPTLKNGIKLLNTFNGYKNALK